jgi:endonuclease/exonuclease/phosphatase family metal-dependent hydrolase
VKAFAKELKLNYLYMPNVHYQMRNQDIGNAILARGSIRNPMKLVLPHKKWVNGRKRNVTIGEVSIRNKKIMVYSVHTETSTMGRKKRMDQWDAILEHARIHSVQYQYKLIGGDFNTLFPKDAENVIQKFNAAGFTCATASVGYTAKAFYGLIKPQEDYIFCQGISVLSAGKIDSSESSDHLPVYAVFRDTVGR